MRLYDPADIVIYIQNKGIVVQEKSLLAIEPTTNKVIAYGNDAEQYMQFPKQNIECISLMHRGVICNHIAAVELFSYLFNKAWGKKSIFSKQPVAISIPEGYCEVDHHVLKDVCYHCGIKDIFIRELPLEQLRTTQVDVPKNWSKYQTFLAITKNEPQRYIKEQINEMINEAKKIGMSLDTLKEIVQEKIDNDRD